MKRKDYISFRKDISEAYKVMAIPLYKKYSAMGCPTAEISELIYYWIAQHQHKKVLDLVSKRKKRAKSKLIIRSLEAELIVQKNKNLLTTTPELQLERF